MGDLVCEPATLPLNFRNTTKLGFGFSMRFATDRACASATRDISLCDSVPTHPLLFERCTKNRDNSIAFTFLFLIQFALSIIPTPASIIESLEMPAHHLLVSAWTFKMQQWLRVRTHLIADAFTSIAVYCCHHCVRILLMCIMRQHYATRARQIEDEVA